MKMRTVPALLVLILLLPFPSGAQGGKASSATSEARFKPTKALQKYPRVRGARERRTDDIRKLFGEAGIDFPPAQILLRVFKREDVLELWVRPLKKKAFVHLKDYAVCAKSGELGPKRKRGDLQVPEGFYRITWFNPHSDFLLSMKVSYPNPSDRIRALKKDPGGSIFIHGSCVTIGCVPLTDRWIEELFLIGLDPHWRYGNKALVHIFPTRLNEEGMAWLKKEFADKPDLLRFWEELKPGYARFEKDHIPARFTIDKNGAYRFR
jgi:murein L,D-transpeptidase YafK